jgi:hypothetical protein
MKFEQTQTGGSAMFSQRGGGAATIAQLNHLLRVGYDTLLSQLTTDKKTGLSLNGVPVTAELSALKGPIEEYMEQGEFAITGGKDLMEKIESDRIMQRLMYLSVEAITNHWNFIGMLTQKGEKSRNGIVLNIGVKGPTSATQMQNYWGSVREGESLYFIIKGAAQPKRGQSSYAEYPHIEPWNGYHEPRERELVYTDRGGQTQRGVAIYVGRVIFPPLQGADLSHRLKMCGLTAGPEEAHKTSVENRSMLTVNMGNARHNLQNRVA